MEGLAKLFIEFLKNAYTFRGRRALERVNNFNVNI